MTSEIVSTNQKHGDDLGMVYGIVFFTSVNIYMITCAHAWTKPWGKLVCKHWDVNEQENEVVASLGFISMGT